MYTRISSNLFCYETEEHGREYDISQETHQINYSTKSVKTITKTMNFTWSSYRDFMTDRKDLRLSDTVLEYFFVKSVLNVTTSLLM